MHAQDIVHLTSGQAKYGFPQMSVKALTWAFEQPIAGNEKVILLCLADHFSDENSQCWPSISRLVERAYVSKSTVLRCISALEEAGYIIVENRQRENGSKTSNLYRLNFGRVATASINLTPAPSVTSDTTPSVTGDTTPSVTADTTRTVRKNRKKEPSNISFDLEFEEFWAAYPKRPNNPKAVARTKYVKARSKNVSHETIVNAARKYAALRKGEDPKYTAMAVTWLHQRRWEEDDTEQSAPEAATINDSPQFSMLCSSFPMIGNLQAASDAFEAAIRSHANIPEVIESAKKYSLLRKARGKDPAFDIPLSRWLKGRLWLDMRDYEFCRTGMNNTLTVRLKRERSTS